MPPPPAAGGVNLWSDAQLRRGVSNQGSHRAGGGCNEGVWFNLLATAEKWQEIVMT